MIIYICLSIVGIVIAILGNLSIRRLHKIDQTYFSVKHEIIRLSGDEVIRFIEKVRGRISILAKIFILDGVLIGVFSGLKILNIFPNFYINTNGYLSLLSVLMVVLPILFFIKPYPRFGIYRPFGIIILSKMYLNVMYLSIHNPEKLEVGVKSSSTNPDSLYLYNFNFNLYFALYMIIAVGLLFLTMIFFFDGQFNSDAVKWISESYDKLNLMWSN